MTAVDQRLRAAAYAVALGYKLEFHPNARIDVDAPVRFILRDVEVFETERGWRVAKYCADGTLATPKDIDFFATLKKALRIGSERARPATEADLNPLLPALRAMLKLVTSGGVGGRNPFSYPEVKQGLHAICDVTGYKGHYMDVND
jgi:hypothetical protein